MIQSYSLVQLGFPQAIKKLLATATSNAANPLRDLTPGGGDYVGEADADEPDWQGVPSFSVCSHLLQTDVRDFPGFLWKQLPNAVEHQAEV